MPMIETINLTKKYGELIALNNLNMSIDQGACYGFIGPNGAGKTTTIKILATLLKPTWGEARIDGKVIGYQNPQIRPLIGYVPDFMGAYEDMVVAEYLEFFAACYNIHGTARERVVRDVLDLTDLHFKSNSEVNGLRRGMPQWLSIATVRLHDPQVLLPTHPKGLPADGPASGRAPRARYELRELLKERRRMGKTIMISSHILHELAELCDTVGIIEQGLLVFSGTVGEIMTRANIGKIVHIVVEQRVEEAAKLLEDVKGIIKVEVLHDDGTPRIELTIDPNSGLPIAELPNRLIAQGFRLSAIHEAKIDLETAFMRLTKGLVSGEEAAQGGRGAQVHSTRSAGRTVRCIAQGRDGRSRVGARVGRSPRWTWAATTTSPWRRRQAAMPLPASATPGASTPVFRHSGSCTSLSRISPRAPAAARSSAAPSSPALPGPKGRSGPV